MFDPGFDEDTPDVVSEINVTPLVDVMLVLLVIFILSASVATTAVRVDLPKTARVAKPAHNDPIVVSVDRAGHYRLNGHRRDLPAVVQRVAALRHSAARRPVQIRADRAVAYGRVDRLMAALRKAGVDRVDMLSRR